MGEKEVREVMYKVKPIINLDDWSIYVQHGRFQEFRDSVSDFKGEFGKEQLEERVIRINKLLKKGMLEYRAEVDYSRGRVWLKCDGKKLRFIAKFEETNNQ